MPQKASLAVVNVEAVFEAEYAGQLNTTLPPLKGAGVGVEIGVATTGPAPAE